MTWSRFWTRLRDKPVLPKEAENALLPFPMTYLCEGVGSLLQPSSSNRNTQIALILNTTRGVRPQLIFIPMSKKNSWKVFSNEQVVDRYIYIYRHNSRTRQIRFYNIVTGLLKQASWTTKMMISITTDYYIIITIVFLFFFFLGSRLVKFKILRSRSYKVGNRCCPTRGTPLRIIDHTLYKPGGLG